MKSFSLALSVGLVAALPTKETPQPRSASPVFELANITRAHDGLQGRAAAGPFIGDFPDPCIIGDGKGLWYAYGTSSNGKNVPVAVSNDVRGWSISADALPTYGAWVDGNVQPPLIWAPDIVRADNGGWIMYYTAPRKGGRHCIGVATSSSPTGPFAPHADPLACNDAGGGIIDAAAYDDGTNRWITWKVDGSALGGATNCIGGGTSDVYIPTPIEIQRMARDGVTLLDAPKVIFDNNGAPDDGIVEAPSLYKAPDGFVLFYSTQCYASDNYDIKYAWSSTIDGTYERKGTLLNSAGAPGVYGPGGLDVDIFGRVAVFHGRIAPNGGSTGDRHLFSAELNYNGLNVAVA